MACLVDGCERDLYSSGYCSRHYNRLRLTGTTDDGPRARVSFEERLWRSIDRRGPDECWPWTKKSRVSGYGYISRGGRNSGKVMAHRAVWELTNGPIPDGSGFHGFVIMHRCDNRICCNPAHLKLGTQAMNVSDMDVKGRRKTKAHKGGGHHNSKLTEKMVRDMRSGLVTPEAVAAETGMLLKSVKRVMRDKKLWKHVS